MGCGCRKARKTNIGLASSKMQGLTPAQKQAFREAALKKVNRNVEKMRAARKGKIAQSAVEASRRQICEKCPHAVYNASLSDNKFKTCEKCNRPLFVIGKDLSFSCPIAKFSSIKV